MPSYRPEDESALAKQQAAADTLKKRAEMATKDLLRTFSEVNGLQQKVATGIHQRDGVQLKPNSANAASWRDMPDRDEKGNSLSNTKKRKLFFKGGSGKKKK